jgi:hypothetical protein
MKYKIEWIECITCGAHIYPPSEVSDIGIEDYVETFEAPPLEPERIPAGEELAEMNKARREAGLKELASVEDWMAEYKQWATSFRENVRARAQERFEELKGKVRDLTLVEEEKTFKIVGKRHKAVYEETEAGWRLKCPLCDMVLIEKKGW